MPTKAEIVADERLRIMEILQSPEGLAHPKTAINFALNSSMSAELANSTMGQMPKESPFLEAMEIEGPIGIRPGASASLVGTDAKAARIAELKVAGEALSVAKGYRAKAAR